MDKLLKVFGELKGGQMIFSWRKAMTGIITLTFATANIGYLIANKFAELPNSYIVIIAGVFVFYFGKGMFDNIKLSSK